MKALMKAIMKMSKLKNNVNKTKLPVGINNYKKTAKLCCELK